MAPSELSTLPRTEQSSDFHCVAGWSAAGLRWEGVGFLAFYHSIIGPQPSPAAAVTHVVFCGRDGYRAIVSIDDALQNDVLLAGRLGDQPLRLAHGAPLRLVSPQQYGYLNAKHLCAIEIHTSAPPVPRDLVLFRRHPPPGCGRRNATRCSRPRSHARSAEPSSGRSCGSAPGQLELI